jgi:hypothetical protein
VELFNSRQNTALLKNMGLIAAIDEAREGAGRGRRRPPHSFSLAWVARRAMTAPSPSWLR